MPALTRSAQIVQFYAPERGVNRSPHSPWTRQYATAGVGRVDPVASGSETKRARRLEQRALSFPYGLRVKRAVTKDGAFGFVGRFTGILASRRRIREVREAIEVTVRRRTTGRRVSVGTQAQGGAGASRFWLIRAGPVAAEPRAEWSGHATIVQAIQPRHAVRLGRLVSWSGGLADGRVTLTVGYRVRKQRIVAAVGVETVSGAIKVRRSQLEDHLRQELA